MCLGWDAHKLLASQEPRGHKRNQKKCAEHSPFLSAQRSLGRCPFLGGSQFIDASGMPSEDVLNSHSASVLDRFQVKPRQIAEMQTGLPVITILCVDGKRIAVVVHANAQRDCWAVSGQGGPAVADVC